MNKVFGKTKDFTLVRDEGTSVVVSYAKVKIDRTYSEWREVRLQKKQVPNVGLKEVKAGIENDINSRTSDTIRNGFAYTIKHGVDEGKEVNVWLSKENQENLLMATGTTVDVFPLKYKVGEDADGIPVYEEFSNSAEVREICNTCAAFILNILQLGWAEKDAINWADYEALYPTPSTENESKN